MLSPFELALYAAIGGFGLGVAFKGLCDRLTARKREREKRAAFAEWNAPILRKGEVRDA